MTKKVRRNKSSLVICSEIVQDAEKLKQQRHNENKRKFREYALRYQEEKRQAGAV